MKSKRVFGLFEAIFDVIYLSTAFLIGLILLQSNQKPAANLGGAMALLLAAGDSFHLLPRICSIVTAREERYHKLLGIGKLVTSITMSGFYLLLWQLGLLLFHPPHHAFFTGLIYLSALVRIILCLLPQNLWTLPKPPVRWGVYRNLPFFLQGFLVAGLFYCYREAAGSLSTLWLAVFFSFAFYAPVVFFVNRIPMLGMLMFPKTCAYLWILFSLLSLL